MGALAVDFRIGRLAFGIAGGPKGRPYTIALTQARSLVLTTTSSAEVAEHDQIGVVYSGAGDGDLLAVGRE
jgi:hypothetical protein